MTNKAIGSNFCFERYSLIPKKIDIEELFRVLAFQYFRLLPGGLRLIVGDRPNAEEIPKSLIVDLMADQPYLGQPGSV